MIAGISIETVRMGLADIRLHKLRSFLTTLGIICGVGAVICMLSISEGASEAEMALIRLLGTHNVIIKSVKPQGTGDVADEQAYLIEYGLTRADLDLITETIPHIRRVTPLREVAFEVSHGPVRYAGNVVGAPPAFFDMVHVELAEGRTLTSLDEDKAAQVCIIGDEIRQELFTFEDPIGRIITVSNLTAGLVPFEVVGVLKRVETAGLPAKGIGERNLNSDVFIPLATADQRYSDLRFKITTGSREYSRIMYSDLYVEADQLENVRGVSDMVRAALQKKHDKLDYSVNVPLERLQIAESEKRRRQITLGCIAGISLLVGGIGIMNIMLATVTERTREIGIRRALGAKRRHITAQFLIEAVVLTTVGGVIGIISGAAGAGIITHWVGWPTIIHEWTILVSFGLAVAVGVFFGIYPAAAAARLDPIEALRHE